MEMLLLLLSCGEKSVEEDAAVQEEIVVSDPSFQFSIAMIADPHIGGGGEHSERLVQVVQWLNEHQESRSIDLVFVLGDIGWSEGLAESKELLDGLNIPYIPVIGDNEVHFGEEENFGTVYGPQYEHLSETMTDWYKAGGSAVWNPEHDQNSFFYNYAFTHKGLRLMFVDWASRSDDSFFGEMGDLHDFDGGTWDFFEEEILGSAAQKTNSMLVLSHIPMYFGPGSFDEVEAEQVIGLTGSYADRIYANFSGHFHFNADGVFHRAGFDYYVTDAVWDDLITVRMVEVWGNEIEFSFQQEVIEFAYQAESK
jgi:hypothetical protein